MPQLEEIDTCKIGQHSAVPDAVCKGSSFLQVLCLYIPSLSVYVCLCIYIVLCTPSVLATKGGPWKYSFLAGFLLYLLQRNFLLVMYFCISFFCYD